MTNPTRWAGAAALVLLAACTDTGQAPTASAPRFSSSEGPVLEGVPNSVLYRQPAYKHATGRSGSATLSARALLGRDGRTELEVTTGELGAATAPGTISKLQLKLLDPDGVEQTTTNFTGLKGGGIFRTTLDGRAAGSLVRVQANVRGIDWTRTDVVTITERVNRRPDLAVVNVAAPGLVPVGMRLDVAATIRELNGDLGATGDCVLYVDGVRADQALGIWVAEGDGVDCLFSPVMNDPGQHSLEVRIENVVPGDWDLSNNSASAQVLVQNPRHDLVFFGSAQASYMGRDKLDLMEGEWRRGTEWERWRNVDSDTTRQQSAMMSGAARGDLALPTEKAEFSITGEGGTLLSKATMRGRAVTYDAATKNTCEQWFTTWNYVRVCSQPPLVVGPHDPGYSTFVMYYPGSFTRYYARQHAEGWNSWQGHYFRNNGNNGVMGTGPVTPRMGNEVRFYVEFETATRRALIDKVLSVPQTHDRTTERPRTCTSISTPELTETVCSQDYLREWGGSGRLVF
jgi:hypothetical protein